MPEDPDDRGPQHTGEVTPQPSEPAWKKRKPSDTEPSEQEKEDLTRRKEKQAEKDVS
jgi:hypothetical protein